MNVRFVVLVFVAMAAVANPAPDFYGQYMAVTETEYSITLDLEPSGKAAYRFEVAAVEDDEKDWKESWVGNWSLNGAALRIDFGKHGYVEYQVTQCLPFNEFGQQGCGLGLRPISTNTKSHYSLTRYGLWKPETLPK